MSDENNQMQEPAGGFIGDATKATNPILYYVVKYWYIIVISILIVFSAFQANRITSLGLQVELEKTKASNIAVELAGCRTQNEQLNEYIKKLSEDSTVVQKQLDAMREILKKLQKDTSIAVEDILSRPTPKTCEEGVDLLREVDKRYSVGGTE